MRNALGCVGLLCGLVVWDAVTLRASADTIELRSGVKVEGRVVQLTDRTVRVALTQGGEIGFAREDVVSIESGMDTPAEALGEESEAARDDDGSVRSALRDLPSAQMDSATDEQTGYPRAPERSLNQSRDVKSAIRRGPGQRGQMRRFPRR